MAMSKKRVEAVFAEWQKRFKEQGDMFDITKFEAPDYAENAAAYFVALDAELHPAKPRKAAAEKPAK